MADALENVQLADNYTPGNTLGPTNLADACSIAISGASALLQIARKQAGGNPAFDTTREYIAPAGANSTVSFVIRNVVGVRFRNAVAGQNARVIARLSGRADAVFEGVAISAGAFTATGAASLTPGSELAYQEFTAPVTIAATTEATANGIVTASAIAVDGSTKVLVEFDAPRWLDSSGTETITFVLYEDGTSIGQLGRYKVSSTGTVTGMSGVYLARRFTPLSGSHTYSIRAFHDAGTVSVEAGVGGSGNLLPGYIRITVAG